MTFLEAMATGRPMRRRHGAPNLAISDGEWLALGTPRWREVRSGKTVGLRRSDYEATDWETIP